MTANEFVLEHWKVYEAYMERKERVIEVATTLYLAFASAILVKDELWSHHRIALPALSLGTGLLVCLFVCRQMSLWTRAARMSNSCQTLMAVWLAKAPEVVDLTPLEANEFACVKLPKALLDELNRRRNRYLEKGWWQRNGPTNAPFEWIVYVLIALWSGAVLIRTVLAWGCQVCLGI